MNRFAHQLTKTFDDFLITVLTISVIGSLILVAIGSHNISKIAKGFQDGITTDFQLQQLSGKISHYNEILTMSARMAAATGDFSWKERYAAYEPLLMEGIEDTIALAPEAYAPYATQIGEANTRLTNMETRAFELIEQNQTQEALSVLFSEAYKDQKEIYGDGLKQWSETLSEKVSLNIADYGGGLSRSRAYSMVSFWILLAAWVMLLRMAHQYIHRREISEKKLRQAKRQVELSHQELQASQTALESKASALKEALFELQQTQVQIVQSEKMSSLGQLVAGVAHEINNPVNFIHANLEPINEYTSDVLSLLARYQQEHTAPSVELEAQAEEVDIDFIKEDMPKVIQSMQVGTNRIRQIVLSLRNFSRSDQQGLKAVDIHEGIESTLLILQHRLKDGAGRLPVEIHRQYGTLPLVECYPGQLNQVFMNLLANSIDAIDDSVKKTDGSRGEITLRTSTFTREGQDWIEISISDTGDGIPEEIQSRIFDAFYTTKPVGKGTGMGLSISHTIISKKHGGVLFCQSSRGEGTEFVIQIPTVVQRQAEDEKPEASAIASLTTVA